MCRQDVHVGIGICISWEFYREDRISSTGSRRRCDICLDVTSVLAEPSLGHPTLRYNF